MGTITKNKLWTGTSNDRDRIEASGNMSVEKQRAGILRKRLIILNKYLTNAYNEQEGKSFAQYLKDNGFTREAFIKGLPEQLRNVPASGLDKIISYTNAMNKFYLKQYAAYNGIDLKPQQTFNAAGPVPENATVQELLDYIGEHQFYAKQNYINHQEANAQIEIDRCIEAAKKIYSMTGAYSGPNIITKYTFVGTKTVVPLEVWNPIQGQGNVTTTAVSEEEQSVLDRFKDAFKSSGTDAINFARDPKNFCRNNPNNNLCKIADKVDGGKAAHVAAEFFTPLVIARAAFLSILKLNVVNMAKALAIIKDANGKEWADIQQRWWQLGGNKDILSSNVSQGKDKKPLFAELFKNFKSADGDSYADANVGKIVASATAALGALAGVLAAIPEPTATTKAAAGWVTGAAAITGSLTGYMAAFANNNGATPSDYEIPSDPNAGVQPPVEDGWLSRNINWVIGGSVVLAIGIGVVVFVAYNSSGKK